MLSSNRVPALKERGPDSTRISAGASSFCFFDVVSRLITTFFRCLLVAL